MFTGLKNGVWPTMITPFTADNKIDYAGVARIVEWYKSKGVAGIFAVCQSSEMFFLSLEERVELARFVKQQAGEGLQVIASGHISDSLADQVHELTQIGATGVDAVVLLTNRMGGPDVDDETWISNLDKLISQLPAQIPLGFYECPYPYKRVLTPAQIDWCRKSGRFYFLKDTSCDMANIQAKLDAIGGSQLKLFNANTSTLLQSLRAGASGYSGVMANMHPDLYAWLIDNWRQKPIIAEKLQNMLTICSMIERQVYPVNAKLYLNLEGLPINLHTRSKNAADLTITGKDEVRQLWELTQDVIQYLKNQ